MANVKKGQTVPAPEWRRHLGKFFKRVFWKRQRRADRKALNEETRGDK